MFKQTLDLHFFGYHQKNVQIVFIQRKNTIIINQSYSSKTTDKKIKLKDEDGDIEGYKYYDDLNLNGYKLKKFSFVAATKLEKDFRDHYD